MSYIIGYIVIILIIGGIILLFRPPRTKNYKKTQGMLVGYTLHSNEEGRIFFPSMHSVKCKIKNKRIYIEDKCPSCASNEIKDYKCANCGNKLQYDKYSKRIVSYGE